MMIIRFIICHRAMLTLRMPYGLFCTESALCNVSLQYTTSAHTTNNVQTEGLDSQLYNFNPTPVRRFNGVDAAAKVPPSVPLLTKASAPRVCNTFQISFILLELLI